MTIKDLPADARPREKLLSRGAAALSDEELLAILLRTGHTGRPVMQLASDILAPVERGGFGGFAGLLNARPEDLQRIKGIGQAKRAELLAVLALTQRALSQQLSRDAVFDSPKALRDYLQLHLARRPHEVFAVLFLDQRQRLIAMEEMFRGTLGTASVYPREVVLHALRHNAASVVLAHNHPSGVAQPSKADEQITRTLKAALALVDIQVLDHFVVAAGVCTSMAEMGLL